jgi:hypothetical protein
MMLVGTGAREVGPGWDLGRLYAGRQYPAEGGDLKCAFLVDKETACLANPGGSEHPLVTEKWPEWKGVITATRMVANRRFRGRTEWQWKLAIRRAEDDHGLANRIGAFCVRSDAVPFPAAGPFWDSACYGPGGAAYVDVDGVFMEAVAVAQ